MGPAQPSMQRRPGIPQVQNPRRERWAGLGCLQAFRSVKRSSAGPIVRARRGPKRECERQDGKFAWRPGAKSPMSGAIVRGKKLSGRGPTDRCTRRRRCAGEVQRASAISARGGGRGGLFWFLDTRQLPGFALVKVAPVFISTLMHVALSPRPAPVAPRALRGLAARDGRNISKFREIRKIPPSRQPTEICIRRRMASAARRQSTCPPSDPILFSAGFRASGLGDPRVGTWPVPRRPKTRYCRGGEQGATRLCHPLFRPCARRHHWAAAPAAASATARARSIGRRETAASAY